MKETSNVDVLNGMVTIHPESLTEEGLCKFIAREHEAIEKREDPFLPIKIWLIPVDSEETTLLGGSAIYIVSKHYHAIADGLSILQMFSLM